MSREHVGLNVPQPAFILSSPESAAPSGFPSLVNGLPIHLLSNLGDQERSWGSLSPSSLPPKQSPRHPRHLVSIVSSQSPTVLETRERNLSQKLGIWIWCFGLRRDGPGERMKSEQRRGQGQSLEEHAYFREKRGKVSEGGWAGIVRVRRKPGESGILGAKGGESFKETVESSVLRLSCMKATERLQGLPHSKHQSDLPQVQVWPNHSLASTLRRLPTACRMKSTLPIWNSRPS